VTPTRPSDAGKLRCGDRCPWKTFGQHETLVWKNEIKIVAVFCMDKTGNLAELNWNPDEESISLFREISKKLREIVKKRKSIGAESNLIPGLQHLRAIDKFRKLNWINFCGLCAITVDTESDYKCYY
jgi:hypothetical protein